MSNVTHSTHSPGTARTSTAATEDVAGRVERGFEVIVFASRWIQAPLYAGLIVAELLYAYKFLVELWEMIHNIRELTETIFMLGVLSLVDINEAASLTLMVPGSTWLSQSGRSRCPSKSSLLTNVA